MEGNSLPILFKRNITELKEEPSFSSSFQFYPNMRFSEKEISYYIDSDCNQDKKDKISLALQELEKETDLLKFHLSQESSSKIIFHCDEIKREITEKYYIVGEGGPTSIIKTASYYVIESGEVLLFYKNSDCDNYNVELHELLHVLGFQHSGNKNSILSPTSFCFQVLTNDIISELIRLYSVPSLPDLYFSDAEAVKKGRYLDFSISISNKGLKKSESPIVELYSNSEKVEEFELGDINYGEGRTLNVQNIRIPRETEKIAFNIISEKELDENNNYIELFLENST